ncbi:unnamed protein product [Mytilus coruscus]|uniref:C-type lectin domain-containing protein n=1 Tax=Mytilus coruscus TaxID=42192 RepID=A0A6J8DFA4_MYTCO|nr:unnamed protein product [Mytilus coruscus]
MNQISKKRSTAAIYIEVPLKARSSNVSACKGSVFVMYNYICLLVSDLELSWYEAKQYCEDQGGHLIVLDSEKKYNDTVDFIYTYYASISRKYLVGASDLAKEIQWKWMTSSGVNYFNFGDDQPNNVDVQFMDHPANCAALSSVPPWTDGHLYDEYCSQKMRFICEM